MSRWIWVGYREWQDSRRGEFCGKRIAISLFIFPTNKWHLINLSILGRIDPTATKAQRTNFTELSQIKLVGTFGRGTASYLLFVFVYHAHTDLAKYTVSFLLVQHSVPFPIHSDSERTQGHPVTYWYYVCNRVQPADRFVPQNVRKFGHNDWTFSVCLLN